MDDKSKATVPTNVLQFPTRKKEADPIAPNPPTPGQPGSPATPSATKKKRAPKKNLGATVLAIVLATIAVNRYVYNSSVNQATDLASLGGAGRAIASIERVNWERDAAWEKNLAESLASAKVRDIASTETGRAATLEEKLRWGTLEEKYTISYRPEKREIDTISFQDATGTPAYILDRSQFLKEYGKLFNAASTKLKSVEESSDKTIEAYTLYDQDKRAKGEARFELDRHKRLLSLKVEPIQI